MNEVSIRSRHLHINNSLASRIFSEEQQALIAYKKDRDLLLLTAASNLWFEKMHQASQHLVKQRNLQGDITIALHELLIDHNLNDQERSLSFAVQEGSGILKIQL